MELRILEAEPGQGWANPGQGSSDIGVFTDWHDELDKMYDFLEVVTPHFHGLSIFEHVRSSATLQVVEFGCRQAVSISMHVHCADGVNTGRREAKDGADHGVMRRAMSDARERRSAQAI